ncbi:hypothetical protein CEP54_015575 [Fusarium duplospermum]|uniref:Uncharacterized protein n=1 Tax=Fusarium duplospermum TaxID=1325734 RepID=A0A428NN35_9HYPO|nr:hypothetical protein CEP54_015575 [Fusarium duplospermum]
MARTASPCRQIAPAPPRDYWPPIPRRRDNGYGSIENHFDLIGIDQESVIILPDTYEYGFDRTDDQQWNEGTLAWKARKTYKVYEDLFKSPSPHPRIADSGLGLSPDQIEDMYAQGQFPPLERQYLGEIADKCWHYKYESVHELKEDVLNFLREEGWEVDGDMLKALNAAELFKGRIRESCPDYINEDDE